MLNSIAQSLVVCLAVSGIYFVISGVSLNYFVAQYNPSQSTIRTFLESLRFPVDRIIGFLPTGKAESAAEILIQNERNDAIALRYISGVIMVAIVSLLGYAISRQTTPEGMISGWIIFIYSSLCSFFAWRFGHKLKHG